MSRPLPPSVPLWILTHSMAPNIRYSASGDIEQIFAEITDEEGSLAARRWIWTEALRSVPHFILDTIVWSLVMLSNCLRVAYRNLLKNKASTVVNVLGLALAVATATTAFVFVEHQFTTDHFHEKADRIFLVETLVDKGSSEERRGDSPAPLGPAMVDAFPQIERAVRILTGRVTLSSGAETFEEYIRFVDPEFQSMFSFTLRLGDPSHMLSRGEIILSDASALKYFGDENPMGQAVTVAFSETEALEFTVVGVAAPFPDKMSFGYDAIVHWDHVADLGPDASSWTTNARATFVEVRSPDDLETIAENMDPFRAQQNAATEDNQILSFAFQDLKGLSLESYYITGDISGGSHPASIIVMSMISVFMLLLSCLNYMNLAIATASRRLKEIGVRKAVGSSRSQLILQFLSENVLTCVFALVAGVVLAHFVFLPGFNHLTNGMALTLATAQIQTLLIFLAVMLIGTGLLSGAYPALYISSFRPTVIFRGRISIGGESWLTRSMLTFQFVLAFMTMIMGVILAQNANYQASKDWGYDSEHLLVVRANSGAEWQLLKDELTEIPGVESIVGSRHHLAHSWSSSTVHVGEISLTASRFDVSPDYLQEMEIPLVAGSAFNQASDSDTDGGVIVNAELISAMGWTADEALGKTFRQDSTSYSVAGVVQSFMYDVFYDPVEPAFFRAIPDSDYRFLSARVAAGMGATVNEAVKEAWKTLFPNREYTGVFQDESFRAMYEENTRIKIMFMFIAGLALLIACMGLYGIAAQKVVHRTREIGIRKVMGASTMHITGLVNRSFLIILLVAGILASPLGYIFMTGLLGSIYADPIAIGPSAFAISFAFVLVTAALTMSTQIRKLAKAQPVESLRYE